MSTPGGARALGYRLLGPAFDYILHLRPAEWPIMAGHTLLGALQQTADALRAGARGAVVGRNLWGHGDTTKAARAFKLVIHDGLAPEEALAAAGA